MSFPLVKTGRGLVDQPVQHACPVTYVGSAERKRVVLTTVRIPDDHIWANGLFQNVYIIYKMLEVMGYEPWLMVDNNENNKDAKIHKKFRLMDFREYMQAPFPVVGYVEMGMSCDPAIRKFFRGMGAKVAKLYLGNILNIDIETITFYPGMNFSHHVAGELDEIWVSPHYDIHGEYAGSINGMCAKVRIAPYVWDRMFIEEHGHAYSSTGLTQFSARTFLVMEPNISFQKNSLLPILAVEAYYRKYPSRVDTVVVVNGDKFKHSEYFMKSILPTLHLARAGKLQLMPRAHIVNLVKAFKNAIIVQHQVNNEYNYSFLEWMTLGYPLVHNVSRLSEYGYYYPENDFMEAAAAIERIVQNHDKNTEAYRAHAEQLAWGFSIYNPANATAWKALLEPAAAVGGAGGAAK